MIRFVRSGVSAAVRSRMCVAAALAVLLVTAARAPVPARATDTLFIRVGVLVDRPAVQVSAGGTAVTLTDPSGGTTAPLAGTAWTVSPTAGGLDVAGTAFGPVVRFAASGGLLRVDGRPYRGVIEARRTAAGGVTAVNELDLESYLYGVIKGEVDPRWPPEAVRAQAVAARTLAVERLQSHATSPETGYDLPATTDAQVYLGAAAEDPLATAAADATRGQLVTYEGRPIFAAYHSNSGGHTEDSENVWGTVYPYLRGVPDPYALGAPGVLWTARLPLASVEAALRRGGLDVRALDDVAAGRVTPWGRAVTVRVRSADGLSQEVSANRFRLLVGPGVVRSTVFTVTRSGSNLEFTGRGSGHGVGLDQWGARAMAAAGFTFDRIVKYYYSGVAIEQRY